MKGQTRIVPGRCSRCSNPCIDQYPSCDGLEDGFQAWPSKPTEYWIICYKKRLLEKGTCKEDNIWKSRKMPYNGTCTSVLKLFLVNLFRPALGGLMETMTRHSSFLQVPGYAKLIIAVKMA